MKDRSKHLDGAVKTNKSMENGAAGAKRLDAALAAQPTEAEALTLLRLELDALQPKELLRVNLNIPSVVTTVLGALPHLRALRPAIARLPDFDLPRFDKLESYVLALNGTHGAYLAGERGVSELPAALEEALSLRTLLKADARALALRGQLDPKKLQRLSKKRGYLNLADDLGVLGGVLQALGGPAGFRTSSSELQRAAALRLRILALVKERNEPSLALTQAADLRARAFTLLMRAYDDARRAVHYLKWQEGTSHEIAPPLRGGSGKKRAPRVSGGNSDAVSPG